MTRSIARSAPPTDPGMPTGPGAAAPPLVLAMMKNRRRPALIAAGLVMVMLGGLGVFWFTQQSRAVSPVVGMAADVAYGELITAQDVVAIEVVPDPKLRSVPWADVDSVVGKRAATDLFAGSLVSGKAVTGNRITTADESLVGVTVKPAQAPTMALLPRDQILLVLIPAESGPLTLADTPEGVPATVVSVGAVQSGGSRTVDVIVPASKAPAVAALAASSRLAIVFVARG